MQCPKCRRSFLEGDKLEIKAISVFHQYNQPGQGETLYAVSRPHAVLSAAHLYCAEETNSNG
jgi:hypothetical protein